MVIFCKANHILEYTYPRCINIYISSKWW